MDGTARVWYVDQETNEWKSLTRKYNMIWLNYVAIGTNLAFVFQWTSKRRARLAQS
jgi:hypothetical protein